LKRPGQLEKAVADFRQSITSEPSLAGIPFNLAASYEKLGKPFMRPFDKAGRIACPGPGAFQGAGMALGRLEGLIASICVDLGALLVTSNLRDFQALTEELPFQVRTLEELTLD
jgi:hypothetical protein